MVVFASAGSMFDWLTAARRGLAPLREIKATPVAVLVPPLAPFAASRLADAIVSAAAAMSYDLPKYEQRKPGA